VNDSFHIKGAGLVGCVLMHALNRAQIPFTWSDNDAKWTAWRASTGSAIPSPGDSPELMVAWKNFASSANDGIKRLIECTHVNRWDNKQQQFVDEGFGWHLNVYHFVKNTRIQFAFLRTLDRTFSEREIRAAGALTCKEWWWGWSATASASNIERASWVRRVVRQTRYLYPQPGTEYFYCGSSIIHQKKPHQLDVQKHIEWWQREWADFLAEHDVQMVTSPIQGWRPVGRPGHWEMTKDGDVEISPMSASGVKHSPLVAEQIVAHLLSE
jgi:hypothetical protein